MIWGTLVLTSAACRTDPPAQDRSSAKAADADPWFEEVAESCGIDFRHRSGHDGVYYMPEIVAGGAALLDYDDDGWLDIYFVQAGSLHPGVTDVPGNRLYRNRGDGTFLDVTAAARVGDTGYGMGVTCGDYDNDGDVDIYVTNVGPNVLYRNNGDGTFTDVSVAAGVADPGFGSSGAFVDIDGDRDLDLVVINYLVWARDREIDCRATGTRATLDYCSPNNYRAPARDVLLRNNGDGTFEDVTVAAGLGAAFGNGLGAACADFDRDGDVDIYVANDGTPNQLWINKGNGTFVDEALIRGSAVNRRGIAEAGMGVVPVDIDNDGDLDLHMSHLAQETNTCYLNANGSFDDSTAALGLAAPSWDYTGFGLGFFDFNHDARLDLFVANGRVKMRPDQLDPDDPYAEPDLLFRGLANGRFEEVQPRGGTEDELVATGRGAAFGDLDNDGDIDVVVVNKDARAFVLRNVVGDRGHWVMFRVRNSAGGDAVGATLRIEAGGATQWRTVNPSIGYCSSNDSRIHCGLGSATKIDRVSVYWPSGAVDSLGPFEVDRVHEIRRDRRP